MISRLAGASLEVIPSRIETCGKQNGGRDPQHNLLFPTAGFLRGVGSSKGE